MPQPATFSAMITSAALGADLKFIAFLYRRLFLKATNRSAVDRFPHRELPRSTSADKHRARRICKSATPGRASSGPAKREGERTLSSLQPEIQSRSLLDLERAGREFAPSG